MSGRITVMTAVGIYSTAQVVATASLVGLLLLLEVDLGNNADVVGTAAATFLSAHFFVKSNGRAPDQTELRRLIWLSLIACWFISAVSYGLMLITLASPAEVEELGQLLGKMTQLSGALFFVGVIVIVSILYVAIFYLGYGWYARAKARAFSREHSAL